MWFTTPTALSRSVRNTVRGSDVSFISWERFTGSTIPMDRVLAVVPDLAVEVLAPGNTPAEMDRKVNDCLAPERRWCGSSIRPCGRRSCIAALMRPELWNHRLRQIAP